MRTSKFKTYRVDEATASRVEDIVKLVDIGRSSANSIVEAFVTQMLDLCDASPDARRIPKIVRIVDEAKKDGGHFADSGPPNSGSTVAEAESKGVNKTLAQVRKGAPEKPKHQT